MLNLEEADKLFEEYYITAVDLRKNSIEEPPLVKRLAEVLAFQNRNY